MLDGVWQKFRDISSRHDLRLNAIRAVAIYQPLQALDFVAARVRDGVTLNDFSGILRNIAYNLRYLPDACKVLWELGRDDRRELGSHPDHPIRTLTDLCGFDERKPLAFSNKVFDFGLDLAARDDVWDGNYSPLDVLRPIFSSEGVSSHFTARQLVLKPFFVDPNIVGPLRQKLIARTFELLQHPRTKVARKAAQFLGDALRYPIGPMGTSVPSKLREKYDAEFERTLLAVRDLLTNGSIHPVACIALARSISWHAQHGIGEVQKAAKAGLAALPTTLEFRLLAALAGGSETLCSKWAPKVTGRKTARLGSTLS